MTLDGVRSHQQAFQAIADDNEDPSYPGTRAAAPAGYQGSVDYVAGLLEDAGYEVTFDEFEFEFVPGGASAADSGGRHIRAARSPAPGSARSPAP